MDDIKMLDDSELYAYIDIDCEDCGYKFFVRPLTLEDKKRVKNIPPVVVSVRENINDSRRKTMADNKTWQENWQDYRYKTYNKQYNRYKKTRGSALNALLQHPAAPAKPTFNQIHDARAERVQDEKKQEQALINRLIKNYF